MYLLFVSRVFSKEDEAEVSTDDRFGFVLGDDTPDFNTRNIPNITEEAEPTLYMTEAFASPTFRQPSAR